MITKTIFVLGLLLSIIVVISGCVNDTDRHVCTEEEKQAEACTMDYNPVCGYKGDELPQTYSNGCQACSSGVDYWKEGGCSVSNPEINSFDECVAADNPVMESYPRKCMADGKTFTEESCSYDEYVLTLENAREIAINSECGDNLKGTYFCNKNTGTYWLDLDIEREGCNPACVIDLETRNAEINWRCTGLLEP